MILINRLPSSATESQQLKVMLDTRYWHQELSHDAADHRFIRLRAPMVDRRD
jgi:hypothetical protein